MKTKIILLLSLLWLLAACQKSEPAQPPAQVNQVLDPPATEAASAEGIIEEVPTVTPIEEFKPYFEESRCLFSIPDNHVEGETIRCGYVVVPEDHQAPEGDKIKLAVATFKTQTDKSKPDPLIFLSGGPGEKTVASIAPMAEHLADFNARYSNKRS